MAMSNDRMTTIIFNGQIFLVTATQQMDFVTTRVGWRHDFSRAIPHGAESYRSDGISYETEAGALAAAMRRIAELEATHE